MKSHDGHVFMERLILPLAFRGILPKSIVDVVVDCSQLFRSICSRKVNFEDMESLDKNAPILLCNLEKIFPPSFFDSMEHLMVHLPYEAQMGGPVQYRWMYPFERYNSIYF